MSAAPGDEGAPRRLAVRVTGVVQGVGFRPFVHARATSRGLAGWVRNRRAGVELEVEGAPGATAAFLRDLGGGGPAGARVEAVEVTALAPRGGEGFAILASDGAGGGVGVPAPDRATCAACRDDVRDPRSRRAGHPFAACASCGPRFTVIEALPYDRARTTLRVFPMCPACRAEYEDPGDRRFHAQAITCPDCGPALELLRPDGSVVARREAALAAAIAALRAGEVVAVKGLGGFQLLVDATDGAAVARLRARKGRDEKPFAVLVQSVAAARGGCRVSEAEAALLESPAAPIVLLDRTGGLVADRVAPGLSRLGVMLPTTPLHDLLVTGAARPLVCTSGNAAGEPLCTGAGEALDRLAGVADLWLSHDRPIARAADDSVAQVGPRGPELLRRARGYAPAALPAAGFGGRVLALGGQQKATATLLAGERWIVGEHVGDLGSPAAVARLERSARDLCAFAGVQPAALAVDAHPDYASAALARRWARRHGLPVIPVQHHHAHAAAVMAEHDLGGPVLALVWDGAGLGDDGTLWGGEALIVERDRFRRAAWLRPFPLPGGPRAIREPVLSLAGLAAAAFGEGAPAWLASCGIAGPEIARALSVAARPALAPRTSSVGRLFDGVAALLDLRRRAGYEGAAAMQLQDAAEPAAAGVEPYPLPLRGAELDFAPLLGALAAERAAGAPAGRMAARFHETLAAAAAAVARAHPGLPVVLGGGCFQNRLLSARVRAHLEAAGRVVHAPVQLPANDGALSLGQAAVAAWRGGR
jgi:hydrogenase maturation protein HypF